MKPPVKYISTANFRYFALHKFFENFEDSEDCLLPFAPFHFSKMAGDCRLIATDLGKLSLKWPGGHSAYQFREFAVAGHLSV